MIIPRINAGCLTLHVIAPPWKPCAWIILPVFCRCSFFWTSQAKHTMTGYRSTWSPCTIGTPRNEKLSAVWDSLSVEWTEGCVRRYLLDLASLICIYSRWMRSRISAPYFLGFPRRQSPWCLQVDRRAWNPRARWRYKSVWPITRLVLDVSKWCGCITSQLVCYQVESILLLFLFRLLAVCIVWTGTLKLWLAFS